MRTWIELLGETYEMTLSGSFQDRRIKIGTIEPRPVSLSHVKGHESLICLGEEQARIKMTVKGGTAYIRAFGRTLSLDILDPVDQARQESGKTDRVIRAPMPGTVVEVHAVPGDPLTRGQAMMTIESMKTLTVITAQGPGEVAQVHFFPGQNFDRNAVLITLAGTEVSCGA